MKPSLLWPPPGLMGLSPVLSPSREAVSLEWGTATLPCAGEGTPGWPRLGAAKCLCGTQGQAEEQVGGLQERQPENGNFWIMTLGKSLPGRCLGDGGQQQIMLF